MKAKTMEKNHAEQNGMGWYRTICALVKALEKDKYPVRIEGEMLINRDAVIERITESPLSVQVRSGWTAPGKPMEAEEYEILLSTGGPALRIVGELDEHKQPNTARLEHQDWGTPWTELRVESTEPVVYFASYFYFGE